MDGCGVSTVSLPTTGQTHGEPEPAQRPVGTPLAPSLARRASAVQVSEVDFLSDVNGDAILNYRVLLKGEISVGGVAVPVDSTVEFVGIESDPTAQSVPDDPDAAQQVESDRAKEDAESKGCEVVDVQINGFDVSITAADGSRSVEFTLSPGWEVEPADDDACRNSGVEMTFEGEGAPLSHLFALALPLKKASFDDFVDAKVRDANVRGDNDPPLKPGDEDYTAFEPLEPIAAAGRTAIRVIGRRTTTRSVSVSETIYVDLGSSALVMGTSYNAESVEIGRASLQSILDGLNVTP